MYGLWFTPGRISYYLLRRDWDGSLLSLTLFFKTTFILVDDSTLTWLPGTSTES